MTDVTMQRRDAAEQQRESLEDNIRREQQMRRHREAKREARELREAAIRRQQRLKERRTVRYTAAGSAETGASSTTETRTLEEWGAKAQGEIKPPSQLMTELGATFEMSIHGKQYNAERAFPSTKGLSRARRAGKPRRRRVLPGWREVCTR